MINKTANEGCPCLPTPDRVGIYFPKKVTVSYNFMLINRLERSLKKVRETLNLKISDNQYCFKGSVINLLLKIV